MTRQSSDRLLVLGVRPPTTSCHNAGAAIDRGPTFGQVFGFMLDTLMIAPREDFGEIAARHADEMPRSLRALLRTMGAANPGGGALLSYLLFEGGYTRELIALGYADAMRRRDELYAFVTSESCRATTPG